ncbi:hypothetical protein [Actinopolymorpha alba]|uniref:hypothetical protein n=1 Tax=Actinopolymorpha alba TaxID=533267 RepID=UPI00036B118B|nr:hypothetical protein [Actinopolymorpha alba]
MIGRIARLLAIAMVATLALYVVFTMAIGVRVAYVLYLALVLAVMVGHQILRSVTPAPPLTALLREDTEAVAYGVPDRPFAAVRRWEDRLDLIRGDPEYFGRVVVPAIADVVDERLRIAHGVTRAGNPERAAELLGPRMSGFLAGGGAGRVPSATELAALIKEVEEL